MPVLLRGLARSIGRPQRQVEGLTLEALEAIRSTALLPRRGRGGVLETTTEARQRGRVDVALCGLLSDGGLRRSEVTALTWRDIEQWPDGSGRVTIRRSKTDVAGEGTVVAIIMRTIEELQSIRRGSADDETLFSFSETVVRRVKVAAQAAGLGDGYSGHSGRVGMARRMSGRGASTHVVMKQGALEGAGDGGPLHAGESAGEALRYL